VSYDCCDAEGGKVLLNQVGKFKCSASYKYYGMQSEVWGCVATFTKEYGTRHASTGRLGVLQIPHIENLKMAGSEDTS
jgi:hypothetical protein